MSPVRLGAFLSTLIACTLMWGGASQAQTVLTLEQCLAAARASSLIVKQSGLALRGAQLSRSELDAARYPQVKFSAGASFALATDDFGYDPAVTDKGQLSSQVLVEQGVYDGGRRGLKVGQAEIDIKRLTMEQQLAIHDLDLSVKEAYFEILRAQAAVALREQSARQLTEYLDLVKSLNAGGSVTYTDVLRTQTDLQNAQMDISESQQMLAEAKLGLAQLIGAVGDTSFTLSGSLDSLMPEPADSTAAVPFDSVQNLELVSSRDVYERCLIDIQDARREKMPTVSLVADAGYLSSRDNWQLPRSERASGFGYSAGVLFEIPLFDGGGRKARIQQREIEAESARLQVELLYRSITTEYRKTTLQAESARRRLRLVRQSIGMAEDNFLLTKSKYAGGSALASDVLSAHQLLTESLLSELKTLAELATLQAEIERITAH